MTEPARRLPPSAAKRLRNVVDSMPVQSNRGGTRWGRLVLKGALGAAGALGIFAIVQHGDDPDVIRPPVMLVFWVGAATPNDALDYDLWYPANLAAP